MLSLSRNRFERARSSRIGFDDLQPELGRSFLEQLDLLFAVAILVVLQTLVDVLVSPLEHAIDEAGEFMCHGRDRFRRTESAAQAAVLCAEVALAAEEGCGGDAEGGRRAIDDAPGASTDHFPARDPIVGT